MADTKENANNVINDMYNVNDNEAQRDQALKEKASKTKKGAQ